MGILRRVIRLLRANANEVIDDAEDPEVVLNQLVRNMEQSIPQQEDLFREVIQQQKLMEINLNRQRQLAAEWGNKAQQAANAKRPELATEALRRYREHEQNAFIFHQQIQAQSQTVKAAESQLKRLRDDLQQLRLKRETMIARYQSSEASRKLADSAGAIRVHDISPDLERIDRKVSKSEARAAAALQVERHTVEHEFDQLPQFELEAAVERLLAGETLEHLGLSPFNELPAKSA